MKKLLSIFLVLPLLLTSDSFQLNFGGPKFERALYLTQTRDGGYATCGYSNSFNDNGSYDIYKA
jgi:hypothetical protein